jgi:hypothetical protein
MSEPLITIKDLYPWLSPEEQREVEEKFERYLDFVERTYEKIQADPKRYAEFLSLTGLDTNHTIPPKGRDFISQDDDTDV